MAHNLPNATVICIDWGREHPGKERFDFCMYFVSEMFAQSVVRITMDILAQFLVVLTGFVDICDRLDRSNYVTCAKEDGYPYSYCQAAFQETNSSEFWQCFDMVKDMRTANPEKVLSKWEFLEAFCQVNNSTSACIRYRMVKNNAFNIGTRYMDTDTNAIYFLYILPSLGGATILVNLFLIYVLTTKVASNLNTLFLRVKAACDVLTLLTQLSVVFSFVVWKLDDDFIPYNICTLLMLLMEVLPSIFHTVSILVIIALAVQKFIIVTYPLRASIYLQVRYAYWYTCAAFLVTGMINIPFIVVVWHYEDLLVQSKMDMNMFLTTMNSNVLTTVYGWVRYVTSTGLILKSFLLQALPCAGLMIVELAMFKRTMVYIRKTRNLSAIGELSASAAKLSRLAYTAICVVIIFLIAEVPNMILMIFNTFSVLSNQETSNGLDVFANTLTVLSFLCNTLVCSLASTEFRVACAKMFSFRPCATAPT